ncbi:uncharacterized protein LOC133175512 [Saccostrea echinata]|uniref:uncharacterized protein LOC133175512 n=1 Tax=Saccostrea echinata TaxID=191078 RepID=UPI002A7FDEBE|nr:uncharacterized protein LOC133175512 [Saccostrea echinata]
MAERKSLGNFEFPETDVTLLVEDQKIHVNKAVLSQHSPVFNTMFSGSFKESKAREITLSNKKAKDVIEFLRCFYPNMEYAITGHNVLQVLPLAHEYQSPLVADCEEFMISQCDPGTDITVDILLDYILAAEKYDLTTLLDTAVKFCSRVDFDHLQGKTIERKYRGSSKWVYDVQETEHISSKFSKINIKTQLAISVKRLQVLEMNKRKSKKNEETEEDYVLMLS